MRLGGIREIGHLISRKDTGCSESQRLTVAHAHSLEAQDCRPENGPEAHAAHKIEGEV